MPDLKRQEIERYLSSLLGARATVLSLATLGGSHEGKDIKGYGYGTPVRVDYQMDGGEQRTAVLLTMNPGRLATNKWRTALRS